MFNLQEILPYGSASKRLALRQLALCFLIAWFVHLMPDARADGAPAPVESEDWQLVAEKDAIRLFSKPVAGSPIDAVRAQVVVASDLARVAGLLYATERRPEWDELCAEAYVHERIEDTHYLAYIHTQLPWPLDDRDAVARVTWSHDSASQHVVMRSEALAGVIPLHKDRKRIVSATELWELRQLEGGRTRVTVSIEIDPAAPVPAWLVNRLSVESPHAMLDNLRHIATGDEPVARNLEFLAAE